MENFVLAILFAKLSNLKGIYQDFLTDISHPISYTDEN